MSALQDAVTLARDYAASAIWAHHCPFVDAQIDEHDPQILECRCFEGPRFFAAQDQMAVNLDAMRVPGEK